MLVSSALFHLLPHCAPLRLIYFAIVDSGSIRKRAFPREAYRKPFSMWE
jgi:hypothetical protein